MKFDISECSKYRGMFQTIFVANRVSCWCGFWDSETKWRDWQRTKPGTCWFGTQSSNGDYIPSVLWQSNVFLFWSAFDMSNDPFGGLETLIECKFGAFLLYWAITYKLERVLTSGFDSSCLEGIDLLKRLVIAANGRIIVVPGGLFLLNSCL